MTLYNEIDPYASQWIRNLVAAGHVAPGEVETRSIRDLKPGDVQQHGQVHFFAGIGVWSHALRAAGWPDAEPIWTGSCPCQPFSSAGRRKGTGDDRHLWPEWLRLIRECRPPVLLGEQVASADGYHWLDAVRADLEGEGYAFGAADLCAAGVGAPHARQRLYFVAHADLQRRIGLGIRLRVERPHETGAQARGSSAAGELAHCASDGREGNADVGRIGERDGSSLTARRRCGSPDGGEPGRLADAAEGGRHEGGGIGGDTASAGRGRPEPERTGTHGFWSPADWLPCQDGRFRPVEPGTFPLAHGVANRVGKLRAYGNALCGPLATTFVRAVMASI